MHPREAGLQAHQNFTPDRTGTATPPGATAGIGITNRDYLKRGREGANQGKESTGEKPSDRRRLPDRTGMAARYSVTLILI
jgi:hypothetical protein